MKGKPARRACPHLPGHLAEHTLIFLGTSCLVYRVSVDGGHVPEAEQILLPLNLGSRDSHGRSRFRFNPMMAYGSCAKAVATWVGHTALKVGHELLALAARPLVR